MSKALRKRNPKQDLFITNYKDITSDTFGNLYQTALKVGYNESYARSITSHAPDWLTANTQSDVNMIKGAEQHFRDIIELMPNYDDKLGIDIAKMKTDVAKYITDNLAKQKYNKKGDEQGDTKVQINITNYNKDKAPDTIDVEPEQ